ncbi:MAG: antitoxin StbD [Actinomycetota bacterium]|nr:antitoxin StbD [Actinomycetota bacterium]
MTLTTTEARSALSATLARFRAEGIGAQPLVFGDHRRPEGVVVPYDLYAELEAQVEQVRLEAAADVMARIDAVVADPSSAVQGSRRGRR